MLSRDLLHIGLDGWFPCAFVTGSDAECQKFPERGIECRGNSYDLLLDHLRIERGSQVVRELFADRVPFGFNDRLIAFVIKTDRARVHPHQL
ncbi:MAG: hypothetical protein WC620_08725 [Methanoregula sp.]